MNRFSMALLAAVGAIVAIAAFAPPATAIEYPWCAQYSSDDGGGGRNCGFVSWDQCMATARGSGGSCERNLFYEGPAERPAKRARKSRND